MDVGTQGTTFGSKHLHYEIRDGAGWLVIDRPEYKNAMSLEMYRGVRRAVEAADDDPEVGVTVVTGVEEVFCVGGGMTADVLFEDDTAWPGLAFVPNRDGSSRTVGSGDETPDLDSTVLPFDPIIDARKLVVAAVNGLCVGGGFIIALSSDLTIASDRARFRVPELLRGVPDPYVSTRLPACVGLERAKYIMMTAQWFGAEDALRWGLVSEVVEHDRLHERVEELLDLVLAGAPHARSVYKGQANRFMLGSDPVIAARASQDEAAEGFRSFAERRPPAWIPPARAARRPSKGRL